MFTWKYMPDACAASVLNLVLELPSMALAGASPAPGLVLVLATHPVLVSWVSGVPVNALNSAIDHQLVLTPAVSTTLMYCAVCALKLTVSGDDVPVPVATEVKLVPLVDTSTLNPRA